MKHLKTNDESFNIYLVNVQPTGNIFLIYFIKDWGDNYSKIALTLGECPINPSYQFPEGFIEGSEKVFTELVNSTDFSCGDLEEMESLVHRFGNTVEVLLKDFAKSIESEQAH